VRRHQQITIKCPLQWMICFHSLLSVFVETCSLLTVENVSAFLYTKNGWMACGAVIVFGLGVADTRNREKNILF
ncbi:hypothetical protein ABEY41_27920, partial [Peribacillus butanolivorans]|uniref:hypothetical protein n=1 Tax=Peribacillus butanolivorans TaxID=421767 RepID=UPI003D2C5B8F